MNFSGILKNCRVAPIFLLLIASGCKDGITSLENTLSANTYTTVDRTIVPTAVPANSPYIFPYEVSKYAQYGYGLWSFAPGLAYEKRQDLMPANYNTATVTNKARLLNFYAFTDTHIMDKETPAQGIYFGYKGGFFAASAYSPTMLMTTQVLDATVQTVNKLNLKKKFDFGISLGDNTNSNQYNELRWYIDVMDGKNINPDSGFKDDPIPGSNNDYQDEFKATGLDKSIPWYQVLGNHDHFWLGIYPATSYLSQSCIGDKVIDLWDVEKDPLGTENRGIYGGVFDCKTPLGDVYGAGLVSEFTSIPTVPADPNRRTISPAQWKNEFFYTSTNPSGHGLSQPTSILGCYSFEPSSNMPVKVIVLDDTQREDNFYFFEHGYVDQERLNWLISELDKGQAEGKLMVIASHVPLMYIGRAGHSPITAAAIIDKLYTYPNLLMWIAGHLHRNKVTAFASPDPAKPEFGFWHVETSSLRDFPQEFRTFEIVRNSDNNVSIFATNVDPDFTAGSVAEKSRSYMIAAHQLFKMALTPAAYNAELFKQLTPEMQNKIKNLGIPIN